MSGTAGSAVWMYRGKADDQGPFRGWIQVPKGVAAFPKKMPIFLPRVFEQDFNLIHYTQMPCGGHFVCLEQSQLFVEDVRAFFRKLRT